jgi:hypothetical protein
MDDLLYLAVGLALFAAAAWFLRGSDGAGPGGPP